MSKRSHNSNLQWWRWGDHLIAISHDDARGRSHWRSQPPPRWCPGKWKWMPIGVKELAHVKETQTMWKDGLTQKQAQWRKNINAADEPIKEQFSLAIWKYQLAKPAVWRMCFFLCLHVNDCLSKLWQFENINLPKSVMQRISYWVVCHWLFEQSQPVWKYQPDKQCSFGWHRK